MRLIRLAAFLIKVMEATFRASMCSKIQALQILISSQLKTTANALCQVNLNKQLESVDIQVKKLCLTVCQASSKLT
jgi:hypothetical protein